MRTPSTKQCVIDVSKTQQQSGVIHQTLMSPSSTYSGNQSLISCSADSVESDPWQTLRPTLSSQHHKTAAALQSVRSSTIMCDVSPVRIFWRSLRSQIRTVSRSSPTKSAVEIRRKKKSSSLVFPETFYSEQPTPIKMPEGHLLISSPLLSS